MDVGAVRASPIGQLVPISGTDWRTGSSHQHFAYVPDPLPDAVALADTTWTAVGAAGDKLERLNRTAQEFGGGAVTRDRVASLFEHGAAAASALDWAHSEPLTAALVRARRGTLVRGSARGRRSGRDRRRGSLAAAVLAAFAVAACGSSSGSKTAAGVKGSSEVAASPISTVGVNPFTPTVGTDKSGLTPPARAASASGRPATYVGSLPGLYGGTRNYKTCDAEKLVSFLEQNPAKATAWASTLGISTAEIPRYVDGLTPVLLRTDTRVTNHGYVNGAADAIQSVLEAGTAVFVNQYGEPVVKCYCGNPLTAPVLLSAPVYTGPLWVSFTTINITIIEQSTTIINTYTLYDPNTGTEFKRTSGLHGHDGPYINIGPGTNPTPGGATGPSIPSQQTSTGGSPSTPPQTNTQAAENPSVSLSPNPAVQGATVTLSASGFAPGASLQITVNRPDGVVEHYPLTAGADGSATYTFSNAAGNAPLGRYNVTVSNPATGASGAASIDVVPPPSNAGTNPTGTSTGTTT